MTLSERDRHDYEALHSVALEATKSGDYDNAHLLLGDLARLAEENNDPLKQVHAMIPNAKAFWVENKFGDARKTLDDARSVVDGQIPGALDELGAINTSYGRLGAHEARERRLYGEGEQHALNLMSVPYFRDARKIMRRHPHLYYRYANAGHGAIVAAMAGDRVETSRLIFDGVISAFRKSEPYDSQRTYKINPRQLVQLGVAAMLIPFANRTPKLADWARHTLIS